jgi:prephenate dehydrogenase
MKIVIIGMGLIGGSLAEALKKQTQIPITEISAFDHHPETVTHLKEVGWSSAFLWQPEIESTYSSTIQQADVIIIAVPVDQIVQVIKTISPWVSPHACLLDVGSTKLVLKHSLERHFPNLVNQFVLCHPIAGKEKHGVQERSVSLFQAKPVVICPENTQEKMVAIAKRIWLSIGAKVIEMPAEIHDEQYAIISHLPHLLAFAFMSTNWSTPISSPLLGQGFIDFTRIAASSPSVWSAIFLENKTALLQQLTLFQESLNELRTSIAENDRNKIVEQVKKANQIKLSLSSLNTSNKSV